MIAALVKILAAIIDFPKWVARFRTRLKDNKIAKLEVAIAENDATVAIDCLHEAFMKEQQEVVKEVNQHAETKTLSGIANYFGTPS